MEYRASVVCRDMEYSVVYSVVYMEYSVVYMEYSVVYRDEKTGHDA